MNAHESTSKSSGALRSETGRDYDEWFRLLDEWGAPDRPFREIADWLTGKGMSEWWAQKVIVEYEQERGIREPGARKDGTFAGGASKTVSVPVARLFEAFSDPVLRDQWLPDLVLSERTSTPERSAHFDTSDGSRVHVGFAAKGDDKAQVAVEHDRLPHAAAADEAKVAWRQRLTALKAMLEN